MEKLHSSVKVNTKLEYLVGMIIREINSFSCFS